jgi:hypothetical protein
MKAEERKHLKENELAERLRGVWQTLASGSTANNVVWGVILVSLALAIGWRYYSNATASTRSAQWTAIGEAYTPGDLEQIIKDNPGTIAARTAKFHLTRYQMSESLALIAGPTSEDRAKGADTLVDIRSRYAELARESKDEPELVQEAMMGVAKAEEVLAGIPKADDPSRSRGSLEEALKSYKELKEKYPNSVLGKQAAKRVDELDNHSTQVQGFYKDLMEVHGKPFMPPPPLPPTPPATGPLLPEAPKAPAAAPPPTVTPAAPGSPAPAPKTEAPIPPTAPPAGINPAEGPKPKDEPKPQAP